MSIRTFVFCDFCNALGVRTVDNRRFPREPATAGRRCSDGRAWFEGDVTLAVAEYGWEETPEGHHACPHCLARGLPSLATAGSRNNTG